MKNFFTGKFRKLSLTQQVMVLILTMIVFLLLFFMFILSDSVDATINSQMYDMLAARQEPIVQAVETGKSAQEDRELFNYISTDTNIRTAVVTPDQSIVVSKADGTEASGFLTSLSPKIHELLIERPSDVSSSDEMPQGDTSGKSAGAQGNIVRQSVTDYQGGRFYYRLERVDYEGTPTVIVSFMNDAYADELRSSLMDSTIYITVLVFFLMLMILLFWVFSIIHPLNQIKAYITQIKEGKDVDLYINREDEIGDVAKELRTLTDELAKQQKSKEEMIHNISHDLKTPIATIKSYSESIKDGIYPYGDLESSVDVILDNANRLENKVHSLLYMNRVEYLVSSDAEGVSTNMKEVIEEVVLNAAVIRPEIELITDLEEVYFDGLLEAWRVCIENILQNAFRYAKSYIKIEVHEDELKISNDGPKMDESRIRSLFLPYVKGEGGRFGLGLSIVAKVVQANKYRVEGMNTADGVCFRIWRDVPKPKNNRFMSGTNPVSYLNMQNWGNPNRSGAKKAAPDQKQKKKAEAARNASKSKDEHEKSGKSDLTQSKMDTSGKTQTHKKRRRHRSHGKGRQDVQKVADAAVDQTKPAAEFKPIVHEEKDEPAHQAESAVQRSENLSRVARSKALEESEKEAAVKEQSILEANSAQSAASDRLPAIPVEDEDAVSATESIASESLEKTKTQSEE